MPGLMVHLITAFKYEPNASVAFLIGNIAPDSVSEWKAKDKSHLRDRTDRMAALQELAGQFDLNLDFHKGVLLHLFLDYYWDIALRDSFIQDFKGDSWFHAYRQEIALSSAWLYHHTEWSKTVWDTMETYPISQYDIVHGLDRNDILELVKRNNLWHRSNNIGPSDVFAPELIEAFTGKIAEDFRKWLEAEFHV